MKSISCNTHYLDRYLSLVSQSHLEKYDGDTIHRHHIMPRSLFPQYEKEKWNIIEISPRLHFILHWCLHYAMKGSMSFAYFQMCIHPKYNFKITSSQYAIAQEAYAEEMKGRVWCMVGDKLRRLRPDNDMLISGEATIVEDFSELPHVKASVGKENLACKGKALCFQSSTAELKFVPLSDIDYQEFIPYGLMRDEESRRKTSEALAGRKHCYDPETGERKFIKTLDELPDGWKLGYSEEWQANQSKALTGKKHYHNPLSGEVGRFREDEVPEGWKAGRKRFKNVFSEKVPTVNRKTGERVMIPKGSPFPRYHTLSCNKHYFVFNDGSARIISPSMQKFVDALPIRLSCNLLRKKGPNDLIEKGEHRGKTLIELGVSTCPFDEWNYEDDDLYVWVG